MFIIQVLASQSHKITGGGGMLQCCVDQLFIPYTLPEHSETLEYKFVEFLVSYG